MIENNIKVFLNSLLGLYPSTTMSIKCYLITKKINKNSTISSRDRFFLISIKLASIIIWWSILILGVQRP